MSNKTTFKALAVLLFSLIISTNAFSQITVNSFYPRKNGLTIATSYTSKRVDNFYQEFGTTGYDPELYGMVYNSIFSLYAEYGISNSFSVVANLPYIIAENENNVVDPIKGVSRIEGPQDLSVFLKFKILQLRSRDYSKFTIGAATGVDIPVGGYDEGSILAIGTGATSLNGLGLFQYAFPSKLFAELAGGYSLKLNPNFDVPDALLYRAKLGYFSKTVYMHASYTIQNSLTGVDIGSNEFVEANGAVALAEAKVNVQSLGMNVYVPLFEKKLGITADYNEVVAGRNNANNTSFSLGLAYNLTTKRRGKIFVVPPVAQH